jgi:hypothetical protein
MFDSDDDEEIEAYTGMASQQDDEEYDAPVQASDSIDPFRAECVKEITVCWRRTLKYCTCSHGGLFPRDRF